jgi:hypothetical protein
MDRYTHLALADLTSALDRVPTIGGNGQHEKNAATGKEEPGASREPERKGA